MDVFIVYHFITTHQKTAGGNHSYDNAACAYVCMSSTSFVGMLYSPVVYVHMRFIATTTHHFVCLSFISWLEGGRGKS